MLSKSPDGKELQMRYGGCCPILCAKENELCQGSWGRQECFLEEMLLNGSLKDYSCPEEGERGRDVEGGRS